LTMETRAFPKRWDKSRTSGGDILEDIIDWVNLIALFFTHYT
jgi:hypothetical protein